MSDLIKNIEDILKKNTNSNGIIFLNETYSFKIKNNLIENKNKENTIKDTKVKQVNHSNEKVSLNSINKNWTKADTLEVLYNDIHNCKECDLGDNRINFVFGKGNPNSELMIIGEAPGADEDKQGEPFVGRSGQLLTKILESIELKREDIFIANILKCRPPGNRKPNAKEIDKCEPYLHKQIDLINPKYILALGLTAAETLMKEKKNMSELRSKTYKYHGKDLLITYHPAALLRNPNLKRLVWEDMKKLRTLLNT